MEIRELYRDEIAKVVHAASGTPGSPFFSNVELRVLRENPRAFFPVVVAGTEIVGIAFGEIREDSRKRVGAIRLVASFLREELVDRAIKLALVSRLEKKFNTLGVDAIEVSGQADLDFSIALQRAGYRPDTQGDDPAHQRLVKQLESPLPPMGARITSSPSKPRVVQ